MLYLSCNLTVILNLNLNPNFNLIPNVSPDIVATYAYPPIHFLPFF